VPGRRERRLGKRPATVVAVAWATLGVIETMDMRPEYMIFVCTSLGVTGQLLLKYGTMQSGLQPSQGVGFAASLMRMAQSPASLAYLGAGLSCYAISTFLWLWVLSRKELSWAYPILSIGYVLVVVMSWLLFKDHLSPLRVAGLALICVGVVLVGKS